MRSVTLSDIANCFTIYASALAIVAAIYAALNFSTHNFQRVGPTSLVEPTGVQWERQPPKKLEEWVMDAFRTPAGESDPLSIFLRDYSFSRVDPAYLGRGRNPLASAARSEFEFMRDIEPNLWEFLKARFPDGIPPYAIVIALAPQFDVKTRIDAIKDFKGVTWQSTGRLKVWNNGQMTAKGVKLLPPSEGRGKWDKESFDVPPLPEASAMVITYSYQAGLDLDFTGYLDARKEMKSIYNTTVVPPPKTFEEVLRFAPWKWTVVTLALITGALIALRCFRTPKAIIVDY